ncbi:hypothetical protein BC939DRAFT_200214 [Gamsiella multidivaricata]|uniref:uncharacterized protein n=1 Tax=Gamsiella multidivaricata TaxID=101098 RepID=UPI002220CB92|nr:uncharacterized protein BC939DRAFT_200214 [Gamsiella multidivaricata]KAI7821927.1 hypothetical protein BC939DRAFT_200214 [Gamsiella multidivaricata]
MTTNSLLSTLSIRRISTSNLIFQNCHTLKILESSKVLSASMILKTFGAVLALAATCYSAQIPLGYRYAFDVISSTIATSGWERSSAIVTGPTLIESDNIYRNTTWSIELPPHLQDIVRSSAPFEWVESGGTDKATYGFHVPIGITGYVAQTTKWHILTGYIRTTLAGNIITEQLITTVTPKVLSNGDLDGEVTFIPLESH